MGFQAQRWVQPGIAGLTPYQPGKPVDELLRELGLHGTALDVVKLASNENPLGPSPLALEAARAVLAECARYPDGSAHALRAALAAKLGVGAAQLTFGNGSNEVLEFLVRAFAGPGDEVVYSQHCFAVYPIATLAAGARGVEVPARHHGHDLEAMRAAVTPRTRVVFIANPNNPTGTLLPSADIEAFLRELPEHVLGVVDEAYFEYVDAAGYESGVRWLDRLPQLVVTRSFSKAYGLAGLRCGYAVSSTDVADYLNRVREPFNVNSAALAAARAALGDEAHLARSVELNRRELARLCAAFAARGLEYIPPAGNFVSVRLPRDAASVYDALLRRGIIVRPIANYGLDEFLRVSVGTETENTRLLAALDDVLADIAPRATRGLA